MHLPNALLLRGFALALGLLAIWSAPARAGVTRSYDLDPGWNAIYVDVTLADSEPARVFGTLPVEAVWCYFPSESPVRFLRDPKLGLANQPGWRAFFPASSEHALQSNLYAVQPGRSYLIKLLGTARQTLRLAGEPSYQSPRWMAEGYTLTGLQTDGATTVSVSDYFSASEAHRGQPFYRLSAAGDWVRLAPGARARAGEAFWIYTARATDFLAPLEIDLRGRRDIAFDALGNRAAYRLRNRTSRALTVTLAATSSQPGALLLAEGLNADNSTRWVPLSTKDLVVPAAGELVIQLGVQRTLVTAPVTGHLEFRAAGFGFAVPLSIGTEAASATLAAAKARRLAAAPPVSESAGLWVGRVTVNKVSYHLPTPGAPVPAAGEFSFNLLLHVDAAGAVSLLKEVWLMRKSPTEFALVTDPTKLNDYLGATLKDGERFGYRFSSIAFDFQDRATRKMLDRQRLAGSFAPGASLTAKIFLGRDALTNPFRHVFHPDHDDKDRQFKPLANSIYTSSSPAAIEQQEVYEVTRDVTLTLDAAPTGTVAGEPTWTGTYEETFAGLHRYSLTAAGTFTLKKANGLAELNPTP